jgi:hypothetical protein
MSIELVIIITSFIITIIAILIIHYCKCNNDTFFQISKTINYDALV